jgi:hypothetical protein
MKIHIALESIAFDTQEKKKNLLNLFKKYPSFEEVVLQDANYLIIIPDYLLSGEQRFNRNIKDIIFYHSDHILEENIFLLDLDNTLYVLDENKLDCVEEKIFFSKITHSIDRVFGLPPNEIKQATDFIKTGKKPDLIKSVDEKKRKIMLG